MKTPVETIEILDGIEVCVRTFGDPSSPPIICWHGFARNGTDFYTLANVLSNTFYCICPDTPGRGKSKWLESSQYQFLTYQRIACDLIQRFSKNRRVHWIGTSMGGVLGMMMASDSTSRHLINRLIINDIGPEVPVDAIEKIRSSTSEVKTFRNAEEAQPFFRSVYKTFGPLSSDEWDLLIRHSLRRNEFGELTQHYDPAILKHFGSVQNPALAWSMFATIMAPMLVIRGEESDILTASLADRMVSGALRVQRLDLPGIGHAPFLNSSIQINAIEKFLSD